MDQGKRDTARVKNAGIGDEEIIELYWKRNEEAIRQTEVKYGKYLFTIAYNILHNNLDCEECLNDTYLGTWNRIPPARPTIFNVFLSRITRNIAIDRYKRDCAAKRIPSEMVLALDEIEDCVPDSALSVEEEFMIRELADVLKSFLETLSEREEFIFVCRYYYSDKIVNIAHMLQISEKTVSRELVRLKELLRQRLLERGYKYE